MLAKFSVRRPYTVLVAVVLVIVLGVVSFQKMTPDLLPEIDLPYVVVMTTYVGATPETVEREVTRPVEQSLSTLDNVDTVTSTSAANYSVVFLQFTDEADLDYAALAIREKLTQLQGSWSDDVGTPTILKISPDLLPVSVAAVSREGFDTVALSAFVKEELLTRLEGVEGIAGVNPSGLIRNVIEVHIDEARIGALNTKLRTEVERQMDEKAAQLADQRTELEKKSAELTDGEAKVTEGKDKLSQQQETAAAELADAQAELDRKKQVLLQGRVELMNAVSDAETQIKSAESTLTTLRKLQSNAEKAEFALTQAQTARDKLAQLQDAVTQLEEARAAMIGAAGTMGMDEAAAEAFLRENSPEFAQLEESIAHIDEVLAAAGTSREALPQTLAAAEEGARTAEAALKTLDEALAAQGLTRASLKTAISQTESGKSQLEAAKKELQAKLEELDSGEAALADAAAELNRQQSAVSGQMNSAMAELIVNENSLAAARTQLEEALKQIDEGLKQLNDARADALNAADVAPQISMSAVAQILAAQNFSMPAGYAGGTLVSVEGEIGDLETLRDLPLFEIDGIGTVRLSDVAEVVMTDNSDEAYARINGTDGVLLSFTKQSDVPTATASANLAREIGRLESQYEGLHFTTLMDQGDYIHLVIHSVLENLALGAALAILILLFFLRDVRPTFVVACAIPLSVTFAVVLMYFSGVTLNIISLSGLAIGVGMLVDNAIVVIENIYRLRGKGVSPARAAVAGAGQVAAAITSSTLTTICVFAPIVFVQGLTRQLFTDMALTIAYSLGASLLAALTLVPCMAAGTLRRVRAEGKTYQRFVDGYERIVRWSLAHKWAVILPAVVLLAGGAFWALSKGFSYLPEVESTQVMVTVTMPEDYTLNETAAVSDELASRIRKMDGVETVGAMLRSGMAGVIGMSSTRDNVTEVTMYVLLGENAHRTLSGLAAEIEAAAADLPCEAKASTSGMMGGSASLLTGSGIQINLYSADPDLMQSEAAAVAARVASAEGIAKVSDGLQDTEPELRVKVDRALAVQENLTVAQVYMQIAQALTPSATATEMASEDADVLVFNNAGTDAAGLSDLKLKAQQKDGTSHDVRLGDIAAVEEARGFSSISRINQRRYVTVSAEVQDGYNVTLAARNVERAMADYAAPAGLSWTYEGENETIVSSLRDLLWMLLLGVLIVYLIMVAQFQSLLSPLIVMFAIPLAFTGGLLLLAVCGFEVSVVSMIGFVILVGIVVNNGIVLVDCTNRLRESGLERTEAVVEAGRMRMRPVLMTALTTILGLLPMSLGIGLGVTLVQPVAIAGIGGLAYATLMTLILVPVLYDGLHKKPLRRVTKEDLAETEIETEEVL